MKVRRHRHWELQLELGMELWRAAVQDLFRHWELRLGLGMELWRAVVQDLFPQQSRDVELVMQL